MSNMPRPGCQTCQDPGVEHVKTRVSCNDLPYLRIFFQPSVVSFPRACVYIIMYSSFHLFLPCACIQEKYVLQHVCQSAFYKNVQEKCEKIPLYIWLVCYKVLLLHPLSRTGAAMYWHSDRNGVGTLTYFFCLGLVSFWNSPLKKQNEKTSGNIWKIWNKVLTFAPAFKK